MKKSYVIVFTFLAIYSLILLLLFNSDFNKSVGDTYLIVGNTTWLKLSEKNKWSEFVDEKIINDNKFYVYDNNKYIGKYMIRYHNDKWYIFDENRESIKLEGNLTTVSNNNTIKIKKFEIKELTNIDDKYFQNVIKKRDISINNLEDLTTNQKVCLDFDNDKNEECLYFISNMFATDISNNSKGFTFVYYVDNEKINVIVDEIVKPDDRLDSYSYSITNIIDSDNDNKYEIIIGKDIFRPIPICHEIYKLNRNRFVAVKSCN